MKNKAMAFWATLLIIGCGINREEPALWPEINAQNKPWTRWWWMGNSVDSANIDRLLKQYAEAGFGGVEITPIYGVKGYEGKYLQYLSPEWMEMLRQTTKSAKNYGLKVDMNLGTGWPFGGPHISTDNSATRLVIRQYHVKKGEIAFEKIELPDARTRNNYHKLQALTAYGPNGETQDITMFVLSDGTLTWEPESGEWEIYAAFTVRTMQKVKRAAPGGEGLTFDHFSQSALESYLKRFDEAFEGSNQGVRAFFNDSFEVYGSNWTDNFFGEFEKRRGYRLQYHLRELAEWPPHDEHSHRVHFDYRETVSDLLLENFTLPWSKWANIYKSLTRNQAHGSPGNLLDLYAAVDIPECETFGSSYFPIPGLRRDSADIRNVDPNPFMMKFASSAAHITGKPLISSETFTWLGEHFKTSLAQCKPELEQVFLSGVNHVFYHGTTYSPEDADWPGWLFYASVNFNPGNSFWNHLPALNQYAARCQSILQAGIPDNELLVYWPLHDYWMTTKRENIMFTIHNIDDWLYPSTFYKLCQSLSESGYSMDFVSDHLLDNLSVAGNELHSPGGNSYKALIIPELTYLSEKTLEKVLQLASEGIPVIFGNVPSDVPGAGYIDIRRAKLSELNKLLTSGRIKALLSANINETLRKEGIIPEPLTISGLKFLRRKIRNGIYYFLVNHTPHTIDQHLKFNHSERFAYFLDPMNGSIGLAGISEKNGRNTVRVQLQPGETIFLHFSNKKQNVDSFEYLDKNMEKLQIKGPWKVNFTSGGPFLPQSFESDTLLFWSDSKDENATSFSGTATYSTIFHMDDVHQKKYFLSLGQVFESAHVTINGNDAGFAWSIPFKVEVGKWLKKGENRLDIEVANLQANRIRWMDRKGLGWRKFHEINFVNINYQPFDASQWKILPSGLAGPVGLYYNVPD